MDIGVLIQAAIIEDVAHKRKIIDFVDRYYVLQTTSSVTVCILSPSLPTEDMPDENYTVFKLLKIISNRKSMHVLPKSLTRESLLSVRRCS